MFFTFFGTERQNECDRSGDRTAIHGQCRVARIEILRGRHGNRGGNTHPAHFLRKGQSVETGFDVGMESLVEGFGHLDFVFLGVKFQPDLVSVAIGRIELLQGNFFGQIERIFINTPVKIFETIKPVQLFQSPAFQTG